MKVLGWITFGLLIGIPGMLFRGYVLGRLWLWFIVSTFGVKPLSNAQAYGIALAIGLAVFQMPHSCSNAKDKSTAETAVELTVNNFLPSATFWLFGWIVKTFWL